MSKDIPMIGVEELHQMVVTYKGGKAVRTEYFYHTVNKETGAVLVNRAETVIFNENDIKMDAVLLPFTGEIPAHAESKLAEQDAVAALVKAVKG